MSACKRGYDRKWQNASTLYLEENPFCVDPYAVHGERFELSTDTDHVIPHHGDYGLMWDRSNWQALCHACHSRKTAEEDGGFGRQLKAGGRGV